MTPPHSNFELSLHLRKLKTAQKDTFHLFIAWEVYCKNLEVDKDDLICLISYDELMIGI